MRLVLADSGFFVGLFDPSDAHHTKCRVFFEGFRGRFVSTWAVFTEVGAMLPHHRLRAFFDWAAKAQAAGYLQIESPPGDAIAALWQLVDKYETLPMDFCDASLVYLAIQLKINQIASVDTRDFSVYRLRGNRRFTLVLESIGKVHYRTGTEKYERK